MGIEYRHFLVVNDARWRPQADTASRVEQVLRAWSLGDRPDKVIDLVQGEQLSTEPATVCAPGRGIAVVYGGVDGAVVERLAGPSYYPEVRPTDRYIMRTTLLVGDDYRIQTTSDSSIYFEMMEPPLDGRGNPLEPIDGEFSLDLYADTFPGTDISEPPTLRAHVAEFAQNNIGWTECNGFWRGALVIDFGKDLPGFARGIHLLPATQFVRDLSEAFRGPLVQIGEFN